MFAVHLRDRCSASNSAGVIPPWKTSPTQIFPTVPKAHRWTSASTPSLIRRKEGEKIADEIAHKGAQREHEYDDQQKPFNK